MEEKTGIAQTVFQSDLDSEIQQHPLRALRKWPLKSIRVQCIRALNDSSYVRHLASPDELEACILDLLACSNATDHDFAEEILKYYVSRKHSDKNTIRSIEFAVSMSSCMKDNWEEMRAYRSIDDRMVSKIITSELKCIEDWGDDFFAQLVKTQIFLVKMLDKIKPDAYEIKHSEKRLPKRFVAEDWFFAERALRIIVKFNAFTYLPIIDDLILMIQIGKIVYSSLDILDVKDEHLRKLKKIRTLLKKAQKEKLLASIS